MAEKLKRTPPSSSIANALSLDAVRAAIEPAPPPTASSVVPLPIAARHVPLPQRPPSPEQPPVAREPSGEPASIVRQFQLTPAADAVLKSLLERYSQATGLELTRSEFLRAILRALGPTVDLHEREARGIGPL